MKGGKGKVVEGGRVQRKERREGREPGGGGGESWEYLQPGLVPRRKKRGEEGE